MKAPKPSEVTWWGRPLPFPPELAAKLKVEAAKRRIPPDLLIERLMKVILKDNLIDAILDGDDE